MNQAQLLDVPRSIDHSDPSRKVVDKHAIELQGLSFYWRISWPRQDVIFEPCGYPRVMSVWLLESPDYNVEPECPWRDTPHTHNDKDWWYPDES